MKTILLLTLFSGSLLGQIVGTSVSTVRGQYEYQINPQAIPTSATLVATRDAYLKGVTITNTTGAAITVTLSDRQASPVALLSAISVAANSTYVMQLPYMQWCPGGFTIQASASGAVIYVVWRQ